MEKTLAQYTDDVAKDELPTVAVTGNVELLDRQGHIRRIPVPSSDPNDPLNLSKWRKAGIMVACCCYSIFSLVLVGGLGSILPAFFALYGPDGIQPQAIVNLSTYPSLVMAFGALFTLPLSMVFGRRPVMLGCCCLLLGSTIGAAMSNNINAHMAARICQGLATGATESVLPETRYNRSPLALDGQVIHTDEFGVTTVLSDEESRDRFGTTTTMEQTEYAPQRTYLQSLNPINSVAPHPIKLMLSALAKMAASLSSPAVIWAILATSITLGTTIALSLTYGSILTEGFGWSQAEVGLVNCGIIPISFAAMFFAGYLGD
ncbi:hypothetical protein LTR95_014060, partial [Oleoguttula sp. CCFEE 5521]